jgi:hypothetical protein
VLTQSPPEPAVYHFIGPGELPTRGVQDSLMLAREDRAVQAGNAQLMRTLMTSHQAPTMPEDVAAKIESALAAEAARRQATRYGRRAPAES